MAAITWGLPISSSMGSCTSESSTSTSSTSTNGLSVQDDCKVSSIESSCLIKDEDILYETEVQKTQIIESLAERISGIYGAFLTADWHAKRPQHIIFNWTTLPTEYPDSELVKKFVVNLKEIIKTQLNSGKLIATIELSVDYAPEHLLGDVLDSSGISRWSKMRTRLFPPKSCVSIYHQKELKKIEVRSSF